MDVKTKIFFTGASGFIGQPLQKLLIASGYHLRCLTRKAVSASDAQIEWVSGDLAAGIDANLLKDVEVVIHLAALIFSGNSKKLNETNVQGTANLVQASQQAGVKKFIYLSTINVKNCSSPYALSKKEAEQLVLNSPLDFLIIRPTVVYGQGDQGGISKIISWVKWGLVPIIGSGRNKLQPLYVKDLIYLIKAALAKPTFGRKIYEVGGAEILEFNELIKEISSVLKRKVMVFHLTNFLAKLLFYLGTMPKSFNFLDFEKEKIADNVLVKKDFNFNPKNFQEGLKDYLCPD